jgi:hypothetical protein
MAGARNILTRERVERAQHLLAVNWKQLPGIVDALLTFAAGTVTDMPQEFTVDLQLDRAEERTEDELAVLAFASASRLVVALQRRSKETLRGLILPQNWSWQDDQGSPHVRVSFRDSARFLNRWAQRAGGVEKFALVAFNESKRSIVGEVHFRSREQEMKSVIRVELSRNLVRFLRARVPLH